MQHFIRQLLNLNLNSRGRFGGGGVREGVKMQSPVGGTYYVSAGRDVPPTGIQFSESVWDGGIQLYKFWEGVQVYLS